jgi:hypothetical protein
MNTSIDNLDYATSEVPHWEEYMEQQSTPIDLEALKKDIKKLNAQATNLKMNLHDLAEDLPTGWEKIPEVAAQAYEAFKNLTEARSRLAAGGG